MLTHSLLNYFLYINYAELVIIFLLNTSLYAMLKNSLFRKKFGAFLAFIAAVSLCGFYFSFDGLILIFLSAELLVITILLLVSLTDRVKSPNQTVGWISLLNLILSAGFIYVWALILTVPTFTYCSRYLYSLVGDVNANDLFIFFFIFFLKYYSLVIYLTLLLTSFTIFFIFFYFKVRSVSQKSLAKSRALYILRQQVLSRQSRMQSQLRIFCKY